MVLAPPNAPTAPSDRPSEAGGCAFPTRSAGGTVGRCAAQPSWPTRPGLGAGQLGADVLDLFLDQLDERADELGVEGQPGTGGAVHLGKAPHRAQRQRLAVAR